MNSKIPYRLDLAGGWLDQPFVSKLAPGPVITISIEPDGFNERSGMASSTRKRAIEIWGDNLPANLKADQIGRILFAYENPPGTKMFSGSQDALGIALPGVNRLDYAGDYWPSEVLHSHHSPTLDFLERHLWLVPLSPRADSFDVFAGSSVSAGQATLLSWAARDCWNAINNFDATGFGASVQASFEAQVAMFPAMMTDEVWAAIEKYRDVALGWKLSGAGGGGYLVLVIDKPIEFARRIKIRRA